MESHTFVNYYFSINAGSADYSIKMWKFDGGPPLKSFEGHEGSVIAIEVSLTSIV